MATKYDAAFFSGHGPASLSSASAVLPIVSELVSVKSVCDVGCGIGTWLRVWRDLGIEDIYGVDGHYVNPSHLLIDPAHFTRRTWHNVGLRSPVRSRHVDGSR